VPDDHVLAADITSMEDGAFRRLAGPKRVDVLIGAPPCQGYSTAGFRSKKTVTGYRFDGDDRNFLFEQMVRAAVELRPRLFLMENVPGMQSARKENLSFLEAAARMLEQRAGFTTTVWRLNASAFGVPQDRIRYFLVASSTRILPARPAEEYQDIHRSDLDQDALPPVTLGEAIFDLPPLEAGAGVAVQRREVPDTTADRRFRRFLGKFGVFRPSPLLYNHTVRYHNPRDLELYRLLKPGEDSVHLLERHGRDDLMRYRKDVFDDKHARQGATQEPCKHGKGAAQGVLQLLRHVLAPGLGQPLEGGDRTQRLLDLWGLDRDNLDRRGNRPDDLSLVGLHRVGVRGGGAGLDEHGLEVRAVPLPDHRVRGVVDDAVGIRLGHRHQHPGTDRLKPRQGGQPTGVVPARINDGQGDPGTIPLDVLACPIQVRDDQHGRPAAAELAGPRDNVLGRGEVAHRNGVTQPLPEEGNLLGRAPGQPHRRDDDPGHVRGDNNGLGRQKEEVESPQGFCPPVGDGEPAPH
jgi:site-specific DNA-cytosine methylase